SVGTWTPGAPNLPTFTYQWQRCDAAGANCANIPGATSNTYTPPASVPINTSVDFGKTLRVIVTATNLDGTASATSAVTGVITAPPAPLNISLPLITGILGSGRTLSVSNGTWDNGTGGGFTYQWQQCAEDVTGCADISGASSATYDVTHGDE